MSRHFTTLDAVMHLYNSLLLSQLDYCSSVWPPYYEIHSETVERVQRRFTRFVFRKFKLVYCSYELRCKILGLLSLKKRRVLCDQMLLYAIARGGFGIRPAFSNLCVRTDRTRRNQDLFYEKTWRLNSTFSAPFPRSTRAYNRHLSSIDIFHLNKIAYRKAVFEILWDLPN